MDYDRQGFVEAADGVRLFFGERGPEVSDDPALVLNDGIGCEGFAWTYLMPQLGENHRVLHWNYRAHGRSGSPIDATGLSLPGLAEDLIRMLDARHIDRAVLFGHSMGTQVALEAYRLAPERVAGLVLICGSYGRITHTFRGRDMLHRILPNLRRVAERYEGPTRSLWSRVNSKLAYRVATLSGEVDQGFFREADFARYWDHIATMDPKRFLRLLDAAGEHDADDLLPHIHTPTLVIAAEGDLFTPPELSRHMAARIPGAELFVLRGASHAGPVEQPLAVELRVEKFLMERVLTDVSSSSPGDQASSLV